MLLPLFTNTQDTPRQGFMHRVLTLITMITVPLAAVAEGDAKNTEAAAAVPRIQVTTTVARAADWAVSIPAQGDILPWEVAVISAKTNGVGATDINVVEGDSVRKGQVLARFDNRLLTAELAQAKANLALATANAELAATNLKRFDQLKPKQTLSEREFDLVANEAATAAAAREQASAAVVLAQVKLDDATVTAPDDGKILERTIEAGKVPAVGESLFRLLRQHKLEWVVQIDAADLPRVKPGMVTQVNLGNGKTLPGKIRSVSPQLTSSSRLARVRIILDGTPDLAVNTYAEGRILVGNATAISIPADSLVIKDGKTWVFRVKNNTAEQVLVSIGRRQQRDIEIVSGVKAGDVLVLEGAGFLNGGDKISVKPAPAAGAGK